MNSLRGSTVNFRLIFENTKPVQPIGQESSRHISNYFIGNDPTKWVTQARGYTQIFYPDLYTGIDLRYYFTDAGLKYKFVVKPGADPELITIHYEGITGLQIDPHGGLLALTDVRPHLD